MACSKQVEGTGILEGPEYQADLPRRRPRPLVPPAQEQDFLQLEPVTFPGLHASGAVAPIVTRLSPYAPTCALPPCSVGPPAMGSGLSVWQASHIRAGDARCTSRCFGGPCLGVPVRLTARSGRAAALVPKLRHMELADCWAVCRSESIVRWFAVPGKPAWEVPLRTAVQLGLHQMGLADAGDWTTYEIGELLAACRPCQMCANGCSSSRCRHKLPRDELRAS